MKAPRHVKLTRQQILSIRADKRRPYKVIAYDYGVCISCIWNIIKRKTWKDLT